MSKTAAASPAPPLTRPWRGISATERIAKRRQQLLDTAMDLYAAEGIANVSIEQVCAAAGLTKRYFYESFHSKDQLVEAVVDAALDRVTNIVVPILLEAGPLNLRAAAIPFAEALLAEPHLLRLLVVETHNGSLVRYREQLITRAVEVWLNALQPPSDNPQAAMRRRFLAYACAGAIGELATAWIDGRLRISPEQFADWVFDLYENLALPAFLTTNTSGRRDDARRRARKPR